MSQYLIYIKSHMEAPDYEDQVEAQSGQEALDYFMKKLGRYGWGEDEVLKNMAVETADDKLVNVQMAEGKLK